MLRLAPQSVTSRGQCARRRHELGPYRILDVIRQYAIDLGHAVRVDMPPKHFVDGRQLIGAPRPPERHTGIVPVERPPHGQMDHALSIAFAGEPVELSDRIEILAKPRHLKLWIALGRSSPEKRLASVIRPDSSPRQSAP